MKLGEAISALPTNTASPSEIRSGLSTAANASIKGCLGASDRELRELYEVSALRIIGMLFEQLFDETSKYGQPVYAGLMRNVPIAWYFGMVKNKEVSQSYTNCLGVPAVFEHKMKNREEVRHLRLSVGEKFKHAEYFYGRVSLQLQKKIKTTWLKEILELGSSFRGY